jgi:hypothetical protein
MNEHAHLVANARQRVRVMRGMELHRIAGAFEALANAVDEQREMNEQLQRDNACLRAALAAKIEAREAEDENEETDNTPMWPRPLGKARNQE